MGRASYRHAIEWIAENDSDGDSDRLDADVVSELITSALVADIFKVPSERVDRDVVKRRKLSDQWRAARLQAAKLVMEKGL